MPCKSHFNDIQKELDQLVIAGIDFRDSNSPEPPSIGEKCPPPDGDQGEGSPTAGDGENASENENDEDFR